MKYMLLCFASPDDAPAPGSPEQVAEAEEWFAFTDAVAKAGALVSGEALAPPDTSTTVRVRDDSPATSDGPFLETKEVLGGYYIIDVDNLDDALEWAARIPTARYGAVEVRPVVEYTQE